MEFDNNLSQESDYQDLLLKLERANENLAYYKSNKEICMRDLHKLELENSALMEENNYLKNKIKNVERNMSMMVEKNEDFERPLDAEEIPSFVRSNTIGSFSKAKIPQIKGWKTYENMTTASGTNRVELRNKVKASLSETFCKREMSLFEAAFLNTILMYRV